ncbi:nitrate/nitrite transporter [Desulfovibrio sp. UCD-KL4C]|uniref:MFS transporter n=1 Tax=Desulfovibrio sp. UCD-KL4C TaxID=2578120 RepID=UPI0025BC07DC|nr:MFS transporter [Desulfovibrio sp. UCD-KL4C]
MNKAIRTPDSPYAWWMLAVVFFVGIAAPINQFKVPPMMQQLCTSLDVSLATAGWLMSVFSLVAIILALPAGFIIRKIGIKTAGTIAMLAFIAGSFMGVYSTSPVMLLGSRVIEGLGMCLIAIVGPAAISYWFTPAKLGTAMGLWGAWVPLGLVIMFNVAPHIGASDWHPVWWASTGYAVFALFLFVFFFRMPTEGVKKNEEDAPTMGSIFSKLRIRDIWLLAFAFLAQNVCQITINSFMPTFMQTNLAMSPAKAGFTASLLMMISMVSGVLAGVWSDRINSRKKPIIIALIALAVLMICPFSLPAEYMTAYMLTLGIFVGIIPTCVFAAGPEIMGSPEDAGIGLSVVALGQNLGMFFGPGIYGMCIEQLGWVTAGYCIIPVLVLGIIATLMMRIK